MNKIDSIQDEENDSLEKVLGIEHRDWIVQMQPIHDERRAQTEKLRVETLNCGSPQLALALKNRPIMIEALRKVVTLRLDLRKEYSLKTPALLSEFCLCKLKSDLEDYIEYGIEDDPESRPAAGDIVAFVRVNIEKLILNNPTPKPSKQPEKTTAKPRVFISYSRDNEEHKTWVLDLSTRLRKDGIDAFIDQTHLTLGARSAEFMERSVRDSSRVLVICTPTYKENFDQRKGGAGYEAHIITAEIVNEVGKNKFIPVLRKGNWETTLPTALSGAFGVDLSNDSALEYKKLVEDLHGINPVTPVGPRPSWLVNSKPEVAMSLFPPDPVEYKDQRRLLPETEIAKKIFSMPRWNIWIRPSEFKKARFQNLDHCLSFIETNQVTTNSAKAYPWYFQAPEKGEEWIEYETETDGSYEIQRWAMFRTGQFVHNLGLVPNDFQCPLPILSTVTSAIELAARMAGGGILSPQAMISFKFYKMDGVSLRRDYPIDGSPRFVISPNSWCQAEHFCINRVLSPDELRSSKRELAIGAALEIYAKFEWNDPPVALLRQEQANRFDL